MKIKLLSALITLICFSSFAQETNKALTTSEQTTAEADEKVPTSKKAPKGKELPKKETEISQIKTQDTLPKNWSNDSHAVYDLLVAQLQSAGDDYSGSVDTLVKFAKKQKDDKLYGKAFKALLQVERYTDAVALIEVWKNDTTVDKSMPINRLYIWALILDGNTDVALDEINKEIDNSDDKNAVDTTLIPYIQMMLSHWYGEQTQVFFSHLHEQYPDNKIVSISYAELLRWQGKIDEAVDIINKLRFDEPRNIELVNKVADFYRFSINVEKADKVWAEFISDYPNDPLFHLLYAQYLLDRYDFAGAVKQADKVNDKDLHNDAQILKMTALIYLEKYDDAISLFEKSFIGTDDEKRVRYNLVDTLLKKEAYAHAKKIVEPLIDFEKAITDNDNVFMLPACYQLAQILYATSKDGDLSEGDKWLEKVATYANLTHDVSLNEQSGVLQRADHKEFAYKRLGKFLKAHPNHELIRYAHSLVAVEMGLESVAIEDLRILHGISPNDMNVQNALGYTILESDKNIDEGTALIKKALFTNPSSAAIADSMGWAYYRKGEVDKSLPLFRFAYANYVEGEVIGHYITALYKQGNIGLAKKLYQLEMRFPPNVDRIKHFTKTISDELAD